MSTPQHLAEQNAASRVREHVAAALAKIGQYQRGYGTHRKDADA